jgi:hypothetical protein
VDTKYVDKRPTAGFEVGFGLVDVDRRDEAGELQSCLEAEYITSTIEHLIQTGQSSLPDRDLEAVELQVPPDYVGVPAFAHRTRRGWPTRRFAYREETVAPFGT